VTVAPAVAGGARDHAAGVPARAGPIHLSLGEVAALAAKAARGAGLSWGVAEEAAYAARWLAAHELAGATLLWRHLVAVDGRAWRELAPVVGPEGWRTATGAALSPLAAGPALADRAGLAAGPAGEPTLLQVGDPALLLPFAALAAPPLGGPLRVVWDGVVAVVDPAGGLAVEVTGSGLDARRAAVVTIAPAERAPAEPARAPRPPGAVACALPTAVRCGLEALAARTYVPATAASRAGAGAGTHDPD
jgi:hypothetical protein